MTDEEVEYVAKELAKIGGTSWYPGRERGPLMRVVSNRYRDRARVAIAALERFRAAKDAALVQDDPLVRTDDETAGADGHEHVQPGATVIYRPPGDLRAYPCRVVRVDGSRAYLEPALETCTGWVSIDKLLPSTAETTSPHPRDDAETLN